MYKLRQISSRIDAGADLYQQKTVIGVQTSSRPDMRPHARKEKIMLGTIMTPDPTKEKCEHGA